jgi:hypothetical protein
MCEEYYSELIITSNTITPIQISNILGILYDECHLVGDLRKNTIIQEKENVWIIRSHLLRSISINEHINELLERISPTIERIGELATQHEIRVQFSCVIFTSTRPPLSFSREQVVLISKLGANIDIDLYLLPDEQGNNK